MNWRIYNINIGDIAFASGNISKPIILSKELDLSYILFHIGNFHDFFDSQNIIQSENWKIIIERLDSTTNHVNQLNQQGGFAITHVAKLEKIDGQTFKIDQAVDFLEIFSLFLSFSRGFRVPVFLLVGYDSNDQKILEYWASSRCVSWRGVNSWFPKFECGILATIFPEFCRWCKAWDKASTIAIHWYLESNVNSGALEGSIVLSQVALELISWTLLVEQEKIISKDGFDKLPASDKLRLLLSKIGIPIKLPPDRVCASNSSSVSPLIQNLVNLAAQNGYKWSDGPHALTELRNGIVHPKKLLSVLNSPHDARFEACNLGLWYIELSLLGLFQYQGKYGNRLDMGRYEGNYEFVPWVRNTDMGKI